MSRWGTARPSPSRCFWSWWGSSSSRWACLPRCWSAPTTSRRASPSTRSGRSSGGRWTRSIRRPEGHVTSPSRRHLLLAFCFYLLLTAVATYPLILKLGSGVIDFGDPLLNSWILAWNTRALTHDPLHLFHTNIFYPHRWTLAYSEL